ncbi:3-hydroxyacyl-CoA dehydrogenase NAD-binding domain-containing protein [Delftia tsuruhatensis]|uniref:3-hydroxyacyl-CoA dehydrogenase n=1 Tax=Delftia tsuruhatensis TaxID=180282 RepID=A0ABN4SP86_9BURK|nr:3-hydroxyacyl-CoA dehydrogenase NAD-binding domain-containing protein [Delftia tsuruhatensis]AOV05346.1 3-hydroxyacyl-CoA dehydrogenase [Delftia tsuruhatensis]
MTAVSYEVRDQVAVLTLNHPPVNGIGSRIRPGVLAGLDRALADPTVLAVVLTGGEKQFSGGADVSEFGTPQATQAPNLPSVIAALENAIKPVVAAIAGNCLGGGLELALGCHWRVAHANATLGLPEVKLGLLPGAGGTQRLPRALGLEPALNMIVSGEPTRAAAVAGTPLVDEVTDGSVVDAAIAFAQWVVNEQLPLRRLRDLKVNEPRFEAFLQFARTTVKTANRFLPAPLACVEAVANAMTQPFDEGLRRERASFITLMHTPESRALRHAFFAERNAAKVDGLPAGTPTRAIARVGVIGAGTMGAGITLALVAAGLSVVLLETTQAALDKGMENIRRTLEASLKKGKLSEAQQASQLNAITPALAYGHLADVDLVIEAVFENIDIKRQVFSQLDAVCKPDAILASNTSALDLNQIAAFTQRPQDVIGLHFFSPANVMRLLEVVRGAATAADVLATAMELAKRLKKVAVVSGVCEGFIGNRMLARYSNAANGLLDLGATPQQVDKALEGFGFAMGVYRVGDLAGLDIGWNRRKNLKLAHPDQDFSVAADRLCEAGRFGQKTGAGWYRYEPGNRAALPDPAVDQLLAAWRQERGFTSRKVSDAEVVERCIFALVNEGARLLAEGIAQRASDIDVVYLNGYGFPRFRGGPMAYADEVGLPHVVRALRRMAAESPAEAALWTPAPLLVELAESGRTFN